MPNQLWIAKYELAKYIVIFRGSERLLIVAAAITAIICGARLFKSGVFDNFQTVIQNGSWKVKVMSTAPGTIFAIAGLVLCFFGFHYGVEDFKVGDSPASQDKPNGDKKPPGEGEFGFSSYSAKSIDLLTRYINEIKGGQIPESSTQEEKDLAADNRQWRQKIANYLSDSYSERVEDLRKLRDASRTIMNDGDLTEQINQLEQVMNFFEKAKASSTADSQLITDGNALLASLLRSKKNATP